MILGGVRFAGLDAVVGHHLVALSASPPAEALAHALACVRCGRVFALESWQEKLWCPYCGASDCPDLPAGARV